MQTQETMTAILSDVGTEVLESLAFLIVSPSSETSISDIKTTVEFSGHFTGNISITVPEPILHELTWNMLGEDEGIPCPEQQLIDALGEMCNVICGNTLAAMAGPEPVFNLTPAKITTLKTSEEETNLNSSKNDSLNHQIELHFEKGTVSINLELYEKDN